MLPAAVLPALILPLTINPVSDPSEVIFGCALVVTVPAVPDDPAEIAYVAFATVPVTFAPGIAVNPVAAP